MTERTEVAIVGAGPAGLLLGHLLAGHGIESIIVETRSRAYVEARIRAGVLEQGTVDTLRATGVGDRLDREGMEHPGLKFQWPGQRRRLDFQDLCGRSVWVYGQTEVVKDLVAATIKGGRQIEFEVSGTAIHDIDTDRPRVTFTDAAGVERAVEADAVAGCDGFHGVSRSMLPETLRTTWERSYPYAWLGILAAVAPSTDEPIYAWHPGGLAVHSMRSAHLSRLYLQVDPGADLGAWSDDRIWTELSARLALDGWTLADGPILDRSITPMRSHVTAPMRHGRLFLAGDAAHIVPPTGAKGLNLAVADVRLLAGVLRAMLRDRDPGPAACYSDDALRRVWRCVHFASWMTSMLHATGDPFTDRLQLAELEYVTSSRSAATALAENYTGLPLERGAELP